MNFSLQFSGNILFDFENIKFNILKKNIFKKTT